MVKQVICEHPVIIVNPLAKENIMRFLNVTVKGKSYRFSKFLLRPYSLPWCVLPPVKKVQKIVFGKITSEEIVMITHDDLKSCYITDNSGEHIPLYIEVPCGHCELCKERQISSFVERCKMESQCYDSYPWFVTLTYDEENKPIDGVSISDVQKFFKRFRINLERSGFNFNLRYAATGEYGKNTHRPHYHFVVWGLDCKTSDDFERVSSILYNSWDKGYTLHRFVDPSDDKTFYYTTKYLRKDCFVPTYIAPDGSENLCNPPFFFSHAGMVV